MQTAKPKPEPCETFVLAGSVRYIVSKILVRFSLSTPEKQKKYIDRICSSIDDTEKILNELLNISRYELKSYKLNRVNVNLKEFIGDGAEEIKELLERSHFDFSLQCNVNKDTQISVDTNAFARVFRNIVMNSIKYARDDRQGMVRLIVSEYDRTVIIELTDNGSGVESENLTKIFDTMYRTDPACHHVHILLSS